VPGSDRRLPGAIVPYTTVAEAAICLGFGAFVVMRAIHVSLTYDEAAAYIRYIAPHTLPEFDAGPLAIFNFEVATNHFLSTALTKLSVIAAGSSELALRLPALAGYAMYLCFSTLLLRRLTTPAIAVGGLLLLNLNPYLLDFFALSRGYGLSIGLMMGALFFFFTGRLARTLFFAAAAVLANFSMLIVYPGIVVLVIAGFRQVHPKVDPTRTSGRLALVALFAIAAIFAALVFSQHPGLSPSLYTHVKVDVAGPSLAELPSVSVWRVDLHGRSTRVPLIEGTENSWYTRVPWHCRAVRIQMPAAAADRLGRIDVVIGSRAFSDDPHNTHGWMMRDIDGIREFESGPLISMRRSRFRAFAPIINWAGDAHYVAAIAKATAIAMAALALLGIVLNVVGRLLARAGLGTVGQWRTICLSGLWVAAFAGPPLYLLRRDG
jgi:hypothetical protein